jgi:hypothetical protein
LGTVCNSKLYFEGNGGSDIKFIEAGLKECGFKTINYLGFSSDEKNPSNNYRPLFIAQRKSLNI